VRLRGGKPDADPPGRSELAVALRRRRLEPGISRAPAASQMDTPEETLRKWEAGVSPTVERFAAIIAFLCLKPWGEATTLPDGPRAERRRRGVTNDQAAGLLGVDASTLWWWEKGRKPHRVADREHMDAFVRNAPATGPRQRGLCGRTGQRRRSLALAQPGGLAGQGRKVRQIAGDLSGCEEKGDLANGRYRQTHRAWSERATSVAHGKEQRSLFHIGRTQSLLRILAPFHGRRNGAIHRPPGFSRRASKRKG
jgi:transcriptional regulator with XRE-family HTH domain